MAASLVFLISTGIAYTDFKLLTNAWPSIKQLYIWSFFIVAALLLAQITVLLYQNRDRMAALILRQPIPGTSSLPGHMDILLEVRNLLAQGYVPLFGQDGHTVYLVQSARAVRGGVAFSF